MRIIGSILCLFLFGPDSFGQTFSYAKTLPSNRIHFVNFKNDIHVWSYDKGSINLSVFDGDLKQQKNVSFSYKTTPGMYVTPVAFQNFYYLFAVKKDGSVGIIRVSGNGQVEDVSDSVNKKIAAGQTAYPTIFKSANSIVLTQNYFNGTKSYNVYAFDSLLNLKHKQFIDLASTGFVFFTPLLDTTLLISEYSFSGEVETTNTVEYRQVNDSTLDAVYGRALKPREPPKHILLYKLNVLSGETTPLKFSSSDSYYKSSRAYPDNKGNIYLLNRMSLSENGGNMWRKDYSLLLKINSRFQPEAYLPLSDVSVEDSLKIDRFGFQDLYIGFEDSFLVHVDLAQKSRGNSIIRVSYFDSLLEKKKTAFHTLPFTDLEPRSFSQVIKLDTGILFLYKTHVRKKIFVTNGCLIKGTTFKDLDFTLDPHLDYSGAIVTGANKFILPVRGIENREREIKAVVVKL